MFRNNEETFAKFMSIIKRELDGLANIAFFVRDCALAALLLPQGAARSSRPL